MTDWLPGTWPNQGVPVPASSPATPEPPPAVLPHEGDMLCCDQFGSKFCVLSEGHEGMHQSRRGTCWHNLDATPENEPSGVIQPETSQEGQETSRAAKASESVCRVCGGTGYGGRVWQWSVRCPACTEAVPEDPIVEAIHEAYDQGNPPGAVPEATCPRCQSPATRKTEGFTQYDCGRVIVANRSHGVGRSCELIRSLRRERDELDERIGIVVSDRDEALSLVSNLRADPITERDAERDKAHKTHVQYVKTLLVKDRLEKQLDKAQSNHAQSELDLLQVIIDRDKARAELAELQPQREIAERHEWGHKHDSCNICAEVRLLRNNEHRSEA